MNIHVAYVVFETGLGAHILGVTAGVERGKEFCQAHYDLHDGGTQLSWDTFSSSDGSGSSGVQSIHQGEKCYYVEEAELELLSREEDPETGLSWEGRQILNLTIANGLLASQLQQAYAMVKPLQLREKILERYIDYLFAWFRTADVEFPAGNFEFKLGHGLPDELWDINPWEKNLDSLRDGKE